MGADSIKDEQLSYAYCILPTTAGSGGAFKLRSVRISQGDTVFGVRGGGKNAPHFIIGVFPRTRLTKILLVILECYQVFMEHSKRIKL